MLSVMEESRRRGHEIPRSVEGPLELNICLPSTWEDNIILDLGAREIGNRRTLNASWPFRCSAEIITEYSGSNYYAMLRSDEFLLRILLIIE